ncbi:kinase-like domain-containing protein [Favolaschia claudopus]|uniref:Kinase-like domain-containing protein n=1 Tax=Favolaschia claudopus TaxID=2862362 RepID=A0AAW0DX64_9AGAR
MVTFWAAITTANLARLSPSDTTEGTAHGFLRLFRDQGYIQDGVFKSKQVFIRLVVKGSDLESDSQFMPMDSAIPASRMPASRAAASRRPPASATPKDAVLVPQPSVRKSAYIPRRVSQIPDIAPPRFMRNPPTYVTMFKRYVSSVNKKGQTCFSIPHDADWEPIQISLDWMDGMDRAKSGEAFHNTGYIGSGSTKRVVYARIGMDEYALAQSSDDNYSAEEQFRMLSEEYRNLQFGEEMRKEFELLAREQDVQLPSFRFHLEGAIFGRFQVLSDSDVDSRARLGHIDFLATRLLPCGPAHKPIQKFTGNDDCGPEPTDPLTMTLHAFSHFVSVYTNNDAILCDLQGMYDGKVMVLIDPQMHTAEPQSRKRMFWDNGPQAIQRFMEHHLRACSDNAVCTRLNLQNLHYETGPSPEHDSDVIPDIDLRPSTPPGKRARSQSILTSPLQRKRSRAPLRHGTSDLFTVEDFLALNDPTRVPLPESNVAICLADNNLFMVDNKFHWNL